MRDPKRIASLLLTFAKLWYKFPDLRFGQLVLNIVPARDGDNKLFYMEDDEMLKRIEEFKRKHSKK